VRGQQKLEPPASQLNSQRVFLRRPPSPLFTQFPMEISLEVPSPTSSSTSLELSSINSHVRTPLPLSFSVWRRSNVPLLRHRTLIDPQRPGPLEGLRAYLRTLI